MLTTTTATRRWPWSRPLSLPGSPEQPLRNQNYGATLGGPIWHDHTFFFLTYEEQKFVIGEPNTVTEPSPAYQALALAELSKYDVAPSQVSQNILSTLWDPTDIASLPGYTGQLLQQRAAEPVTATTLWSIWTTTSATAAIFRRSGTSARAMPMHQAASLSALTCQNTSRPFPRTSRTTTWSGTTTSAPT